MRRLILAGLVACSSKAEGTVALTTGGESDVFAGVATLVLEREDSEGKLTEMGRKALPADTIDLGELDSTIVARVRATGLDAAGQRLVFGTTVLVQLGALDKRSLPLFVQRTGQLARMPGTLADAREAPLVASALGRYVVIAGGDKTTQIYDLLTLAPLPTPPSLPRAPRSMALRGSALLVIDDAGASFFDLTASTSGDVQAPTGGAFSEVAGGETIALADGSSYVVGATRRTGDATARVLKIDDKGTLTFLSLTTPRRGAAATWIDGRGLVVIGGSSTAAGAEVIAVGATSGTPLPFAPDPREGAAACAIGQGRVAVLGSGGPPRTLDLACGQGCAPQPVAGTTLGDAHAACLEGAALFTGDEADGTTKVVRFGGTGNASDGTSELALKIPRRRARPVRTATGAIAVCGGAATIESFFP